MANTYSSLFYHIVFSTKHRQDFINKEIENRVWAYIGGVGRKHKLTALQVGGIENHIHALIMSAPVLLPGKTAQFLKGDSSKWIHEEFLNLRAFAWQDGFGVFSVSKSNVPKVIEYIKNQRQHHQAENFEDEYVKLMKLHGVEYDERYLFD
ncbi:MAG TPA: IS200/IS605 family transposase [Pyrinomonadaceae bacterium]|jgi:REP element-mobilizing transposase RayT